MTIEQLRLIMPELPPRLQDAARYLANHTFDATTCSMRKLAVDAGVTPASFTRLAQALGYTGWDDLRALLVEARRPADPTSVDARTRADLLPAMLAADQAALTGLDVEPVAAAAMALHKAPRIWCAGSGSCRAVAGLLHYHLRAFGLEARLVGAEGLEELDHSAFSAQDAIILVSIAPHPAESMRTVAAARCAGAILIAVISNATIDYATHLLYFISDGPATFPSLAGAVSLAQALAAKLLTVSTTSMVERR